jgi:hypothetical protein
MSKAQFVYVKIDKKKLVKLAEKMQPAIIELAKT